MLGAEHLCTLTSMTNLAVAYSCLGKWDEAEQLGVQVLDMSKKTFVVEHPITFLSMINLAITYLCQGKWNEAEQLEVQMLDMSKTWCRTSRHHQKHGKSSKNIC